MSPISASAGEAWILVGAIALFAGTAVHMIRALVLSKASKGANVRVADKLDLVGWGLLCAGAFVVAVGTWGTFYG